MNDYIAPLLAVNAIALGAITAFIAYQQWRTNDLKLKFELYERRFVVYDSLVAVLATMEETGSIEMNRSHDLMRKTKDSNFLFDTEISKYLDAVCKKAVELHNTTETLKKPNLAPERVATLESRKSELVRWFTDQFSIAERKFARFLRLS